MTLALLTGLGDSAHAATICGDQPVPAGWVVTGVQYNVQTCGSAPNKQQLTIVDPPTDGSVTYVCPLSSVPPNFVILSTGAPPNFNNCFQLNGTSKDPVRALEVPTGTTDVCDGSHEPADFVRIKAGSYNYCSGGVGSPAGPGYTIARPAGGTTATWTCPGSNIPDGYVIIAHDSNTVCATGPRSEIKLPSQTSSTAVCQGSPVPPGFVYHAMQTKSYCGSTGGSGPGFDIVPAAAGQYSCSAAVPSGFVIVGIATTSPTDQCSGGLAYLLGTVPATGTVQNACDVTAIPSNVILVGRPLVHACDAAGPNLGIALKAPIGGGPFPVCDGSPIPTGLVITSKSSNAAMCGPGGVSGPGFTLRVPDPSVSTQVCDGSPVPDGFVITGESSTVASCEGGPGFSIASPVDGATACSTNIPPDFVITSVGTNAHCSPNLSYVVERPPRDGSPTTACALTPLPTDFVITARGDAPACRQAGSNLSIAIEVPTVSSLSVCSGSHVPPAYIVTAYGTSYTGCGTGGGSGPGFAIAIPNAAGSAACPDSPIPAGFVMVGYGNLVPCGTNGGSIAGMVVALPDATGDTTICQGSPIPTGFEITGSATSTSCGTKAAYVLSPIQTGLDAVPFIDAEPGVDAPPPSPAIQCPGDTPGGGLLVGAQKNTAVCP